MHELSIAHNIVDTCNQAAEEAGADQVTVVHLRLGALSGVVTQSLQFSWDIATTGTKLAGAQLVIEELPVVVHCPSCAKAVELPDSYRFRCPVCNTPTPDVVQGKELEIVSIEIPETDTV